MKQFYIDSQFGIPIWLNVIDGIIQGFDERERGDSICKKLNERYKGKDITFFKKDFEQTMAPAYYRVYPYEYRVTLRQIANVERQIEYQHGLRTVKEYATKQEQIMDRIKALEKELALFRKELREEREDLKNKHNFEV